MHFNVKEVVHLAGLKGIEESIKKPSEYFNNNVIGSMTLIEIMKKFDCKIIVFSSSAAVYGNPHALPVKENFPLKKIMVKIFYLKKVLRQ